MATKRKAIRSRSYQKSRRNLGYCGVVRGTSRFTVAFVTDWKLKKSTVIDFDQKFCFATNMFSLEMQRVG